MKRKLWFWLKAFLMVANLNAQDLGLIKGLKSRHFQLFLKKDTIDFLKVDENIDSIKPVIIFLQGSRPTPLIINFKNKNGAREKFIAPLSNFDYKKIAQKFHIILISIPHTPVEVDASKLNKDYCVITDSNDQNSYHKNYLEDNYAENYTLRTKAVINYLYQQKWVDNERIILFGHSRGSAIAVGAALNNSKVFCVGYSCGNPLGRIDQLVREQRKLSKDGKITAEESQKQIESIYDMWREINKTPLATTTEFGDPNKTWTSFSKSILDDLLKLKQPLYVCYGTEDITASFCDLLPIYFIRENKRNLTFKPYLGLEHNFFELDKDGNANYQKNHWQDVMDDFINWINIK
jgi:hypothetical protein